jgi:hypothetical protein
MKTVGRLAIVVLLVGSFATGYLSWQIANPSVEDLPLSAQLISIETDQGRSLRDRAVDRADLELLEAHFEAQQYASYCGVASGVIALNSLGMNVTQDDFFDGLASDVHGGWATFYGGMTLDQLGHLLAAHGARAEVVHVGDTTVDAFRSAARENLSRAGDFVLINYLRSAIGQKSGGHISPIGAYDEVTDRFLVLDVSTYKYPPVWVKADAIFSAMDSPDSASGNTRGYVLVSRG